MEKESGGGGLQRTVHRLVSFHIDNGYLSCLFLRVAGRGFAYASLQWVGDGANFMDEDVKVLRIRDVYLGSRI